MTKPINTLKDAQEALRQEDKEEHLKMIAENMRVVEARLDKYTQERDFLLSLSSTLEQGFPLGENEIERLHAERC